MVTASLTESMGEGVIHVKVMTDEQMEDLRRQISVYATICEQLVEMHKAITARNDSIAGMSLANVYFDPLMTSGGHKIAARQRWTPTPIQLQILESMFDQGNGTPSKQKIKQIAHDLFQHGQISETNVYNWFQNRRARSKRKQMSALPSSTESEAEAEGEALSKSKAKSQKISSNYNSSPTNLKSSGTLGQMSFYQNILSNPRIDHLMEKMEVPEGYNPCQSGGRYDLLGRHRCAG